MSSKPSESAREAIGHAIMRWQDATALFDEEVGKRLNLSLSERQCLSCLAQGPRPARDIAEATRLTRGAVTTLLDRLEARDLVRRTPDTHDRRQILVAMTESAQQATMHYYAPIAMEGMRFLAGFSDEQLTTILAFIEGATDLQLAQVDRLRA